MVIPIFKKGSRKQPENYQPISNICTMSKVVEVMKISRLLSLKGTIYYIPRSLDLEWENLKLKQLIIIFINF